jgi:ABC-type protease/lipase transport system fused ATPase/permease subunit
MGSRLSYKQFEEFDPLNGRYGRALFGQLLIFAAAPILILVVALFLGLIFKVLLKSDGLATLIFIVAGLATVAVIVGVFIWLFSKMPIPISEWIFFIDGAEAAEATAFEHMVWSVEQREVDLDQVRIKRISSGRKASRDYLELSWDLFTAYIACFSQGQDLYVGWSVWWAISPIGWLKEAIVRLIMNITGQHTRIHVMNRYMTAKALRETIHSAAREGIDVAMGNVKGQSAGTIGSDIPVELVTK